MEETIFRGQPLVVIKPNIWDFLLPQLQNYWDFTAQADAESKSSTTFKDLVLMSSKVSTLLQMVEMPKGSIILFKCTNSLLLAPLLLGTWKARFACALVHPSCKEAELQNMKEITKCTLLIEDCPIQVTINGEKIPFLSYNISSIINSLGREEIRGETYVFPIELVNLNNNNEENEDLALILCSSGSTGLPKGVALSHQNVIVALHGSHNYAKEGEAALSVLPLSHAFGLILMLMSLREGAVFVMMNKFSLENYLKTAYEYSVKTLYLVPPVLQMIGNFIKEAADYLQTVTRIWTGASAVRSELQEKVSQALALKPTLYHSYGMTETTFTVFAGAARAEKPGSCGTINNGFFCKVVDPATKMSLPINMDGELYVKSDSVMMGYLQNPKATEEAFDEYGWLRTGDLGHFDSDHFFYVSGRIKEMIKCNSHQVSPNELEQVVIGVPGVEEVIVVGVPDEVCGEVPVALVVKQKSSSVTEQIIMEKVRGTLSSYKQLRNVVFFNQLPESPSGKPLRKQALAMIYPPRNLRVEAGMEDTPTKYNKNPAKVVHFCSDDSL